MGRSARNVRLPDVPAVSRYPHVPDDAVRTKQAERIGTAAGAVAHLREEGFSLCPHAGHAVMPRFGRPRGASPVPE